MGEEAPMSIPTDESKDMDVVVEQRRIPSLTDTAHSSEQEAEIDSAPMSPRNLKNPLSRAQTSEMSNYFVGPRDLNKHSKWPVFMQMHGSILPEMVLPLVFVAIWSTAITCICRFVYNLSVNQVLLTVLGFVVGLGLSFRSSTAYERYGEGRKYWSQLMLASQNLARVIWIHGIERPGDQGKKDLLNKISGMNLVVAFSVALKHKLRFEPYTSYEDLSGLVGHLNTLAREATTPDSLINRKHSTLKSAGEYLGVSFAESNPRKLIKKSTKPLGNLPLEILSYLASYVDDLVESGQLKVPMQQTLAYNNMAALNEVLIGCDRILNTPLPIAYSISIAQITWVYIIMLPFQLYGTLKWVTIPASIIAAYIILGILLIGREIENPFGQDVNDLPLDSFCQQIATDIDIVSSRKKPAMADFMTSPDNKVLFPLSSSGYPAWAVRSERVIREELTYKTEVAYAAREKVEHVVAEKTGDDKV